MTLYQSPNIKNPTIHSNTRKVSST